MTKKLAWILGLFILFSLPASALTLRSFKFTRDDGTTLTLKIHPNFKMTFDGDDILITSNNEKHIISSKNLENVELTEPTIDISTLVPLYSEGENKKPLFIVTSEGLKLSSSNNLNTIYLYSTTGELKCIYILSDNQVIPFEELPYGISVLTNGAETIKYNRVK